ncbi:MAG: holo-ACP synthase [Ignavibacteriales bacterium]|nr:holo-ACP synthase [Ignavibacteriales bacterium]
MIVGTGVDIIEIDRIQKSIERYEDRFLNKIYTPTEIEYCSAKADKYRRFAARWAIKEAVYKALMKFDETIAWKDISVKNDSDGAPVLEELEKITRIKEMGISVHITLSHSNNYAVAMAIAEK